MKIWLLQPAQQELAEAIGYYNHERPGLGDAFRHEAWQAIERIQAFPMAWSPLTEHIRRCQLHRFPYGVIYAPAAREIVVVAIAHLHRSPAYWRSRMQQS
ncbi:type II toxin-antitoxin system RelE/ParE family toxin [Castellaniella sp.]|uniref:type II toxin-antitoxin system RelE/ParE family toxin n=1 Tax=Castellaniella sp. TaxID=1955812 RepID=UPI002AFF11D1|nr:type II toxin-antitoxin system RelE/ParE family toxin [Castellaniella sp.]